MASTSQQKQYWDERSFSLTNQWKVAAEEEAVTLYLLVSRDAQFEQMDLSMLSY